MKVLVVEDEALLCAQLMEELRAMGYVVESAGSVHEAIEKVALYTYDALVLDIGLPDGSGMQVLKALKGHLPSTGVLILSAKDSLDDKLQGLDLGADDYLTKPFHTSELIARLKSIFRRRSLQGRLQLVFGSMCIVPEENSVTILGHALELTPKEYELLLYFASNEGRVLTKAEIAEHLWGDMADSYDDFDFIYAHVKNLRKKLIDHGGEDWIKTTYGVGYKFVPA
jgi:DNA-binding response OmpR family regulator